ncbi:MAG: hypothetical protein PHT13_00265 [Methanosarcina sp.]|nr:hypothetical protein [Methanosarcina sp.]
MVAGFTHKQCSVTTLMEDIATDIFTNVSGCTRITENVPADEYLIYYTTDALYINIEEYINISGAAYSIGVKITYSSQWDTFNEIPMGTVYTTYIPVWYSNSSAAYIDTENEQNYWRAKKFMLNYWADAYGIQMHISNSENPEGFATAVAVMHSIEFIPTAALEYNDGYSHIFTTFYISGTVASGVYDTSRTHPFLYNGDTVNYQIPMNGYQSQLNDDVYFEFPWIYNDPGEFYLPVYRTNRWFVLDQTYTEYIPGSIITWTDGGVERKFIVCDMITYSGYPSGYVYVCIPYENAKAYA